MQRRDLKRGSRDARDRARHRGKRTTTRIEDTALEVLAEWLRAHIPEDAEDAEDVDLTAFARATSHIGLSLGERYRKLAIRLEMECGAEWPVLEQVYRASIEADPDNPRAWSSRALVRFWSLPYSSTAEQMRSCLEDARQAVALAPDDGHAHGILGYLLYEAALLDEAEPVLRRSIALGDRGWSQLNLAHTLHDQERWQEAAQAYGALRSGDFSHHGQWRIHVAREQRASCLLRAGQAAEALQLYDEVLTRIERALDACLDGMNSPVLAVYPGQYLFEDQDRLPSLSARIAVVRRSHETDGVPEPS